MGLTFANSLFLWGLAAAAVPVLIHLIKRNRAVRLHFAAMRFLQIEPNQRTRSQRLKQIILLAMRILAMVLLALAFARPFLQNLATSVFWGETPQSAVVLIDNSFSMAYEDNLNEAIAKAEEIIRTFNPGDDVTVMEFAESSRILAEAETDFIKVAGSVGSKIRPSERSTNLVQAIQTAETLLLDSSKKLKTIYVISDFQESGWENIYQEMGIDPNIRLEPVSVLDKSGNNLSVYDVRISKKESYSRTAEVLSRIRNYGDAEQSVEVSLNLNEKRVARRRINISAGDEAIVSFPNVRLPAGWTSGYFELVADEPVVVDNRYYFVQDTKERAEILAVDGEPSQDPIQDELFFIERAINLPGLAKYNLVKTDASRLSSLDFGNYRVVLLANLNRLERTTAERLSYYVRGGGGLIISLGDQIKPTVFNQLFKDLAPAKLQAPAFARLQKADGVILSGIDYQHPVFRLFSDPGEGDPSTAQIFQYFITETLPSATTLAYYDDESPALLERKVGQGKVLLFTSSFDSEWTDLPVNPMFLPILYQMIDYVALEPKGQKAYLVGNPVSVQRFKSPDTEAYFIRKPDGEVAALTDGIFSDAQSAGIYEVLDKNRKFVRSFAVNVDPLESDLTASTPEALEKRFANTNGNQPTADVASVVTEDSSERNQKMWRFVFLALILLLLGEGWLANRTYR